MNPQIKFDQGKGRAFIVLYEDVLYEEFARAVSDSLGEKVRVIGICVTLINDLNWRDRYNQLFSLLKELSLKQAVFVGLGGASSLALNFALREPKLVRAIVLVDANSRPHPNLLNKIIDYLEAALPLGLPMRLRGKGFDIRPFLQRIRCPSLVLTTKRADAFTIQESKHLASGMPTSFYSDLNNVSDERGEFCKLVTEFEAVPAKCPQKNILREEVTSSPQ